MPIKKTLLQKFENKYIVVDSGCWIWIGAMSAGYGVIHHNKMWTAHRASYELHVGPVEQGLHVDHLCRVPLCVNWRHLEVVTPAENNRRLLEHIMPLGGKKKKRFCVHGHDLSISEEVYLYKGKRLCRICSRARQASWQQRQSCQL